MNRKEHNIPAFVKPLQGHNEHDPERYSKLLQVGDRADLVIRELEFEREFPLENVSLHEKAVLLKNTLEELEQKYAIRIAPTRFIVAENETGRESVFALVDNVTDSEHVSTEEQDALLHSLWKNLIAYVDDKLSTGGYFLTDIHRLDQYEYGRTGSDTENHLYLVDVDPYLSEATPEHLYNFSTMFLENMHIELDNAPLTGHPDLTGELAALIDKCRDEIVRRRTA